MPNEAEVYLAIGAIQRRQGKWAESTANLEKAVSLNPKEWWSLQNLTHNYTMLRDFAKANQTIDRALAANPTALGPWEVKSKLAISEKGDFSVAERAFETVKSFPMTSEQKLKITVAERTCFFWSASIRQDCSDRKACPTIKLAAYPNHLWAGGLSALVLRERRSTTIRARKSLF